MRVLFCNYEYPPLGGGGGVANALLAEELAKRHEVTVLTSGGLGLPAESVVDGARVVRLPIPFRRQQAAANLVSLLAYVVAGLTIGGRRLDGASFDVVNTHFVLPSGPVGDALARRMGVPNVLTVHGGDLYDPSKWISPHRHALLRAWVRRLLKRADRVVGQSSNTIDNVRRYYVPDMGVVRIPLGIRRPPPGAAARAAYGFRDDDVLLITVGRLVARKAVDQLIGMMPGLGANAQLLVLGCGPLEAALRQEAARRNVGDRTRFLGRVDDAEKFRLLRMADVFVSTSQHEGFGLMFLEAMACGLPVVCYGHGGQTDFLANGATGHVVPLNDTAAFERGCRALIEDPAARRRMGAANLSRVEEFYIDACARRYEAVFEQAIEARRVTAGDGRSGARHAL